MGWAGLRPFAGCELFSQREQIGGEGKGTADEGLSQVLTLSGG
jgi:hypothetical protein